MITIQETMDLELKEFLNRHGIESNDTESDSLTDFMLKNHIRIKYGNTLFYIKKFSWSYGFDDFRRYKVLKDSHQYRE